MIYRNPVEAAIDRPISRNTAEIAKSYGFNLKTKYCYYNMKSGRINSMDARLPLSKYLWKSSEFRGPNYTSFEKEDDSYMEFPFINAPFLSDFIDWLASYGVFIEFGSTGDNSTTTSRIAALDNVIIRDKSEWNYNRHVLVGRVSVSDKYALTDMLERTCELAMLNTKIFVKQ